MLLELDVRDGITLPDSWRELLQRTADAAGRVEGLAQAAAAHVLVTDDAEIHEINRTYRQVDRATDVLSFPTVRYAPGQHAGVAEGLLDSEYDPDIGAARIGDIVISLEHVMRQAAEYGHSPERELSYLLAHGLFHLMGYDHMEEDERRVMRAMEEKTMSEIQMERYDREDLIRQAREALTRAYAPYSHYRVGACLLGRSGRTYTGCNVENASYGVTNCAERTALFKAVSEGEREFEAIAIVTEKFLGWPCGICRQALYEFAPDLQVIVACGDQVDSACLRDLLPHGFGAAPDVLGKE